MPGENMDHRNASLGSAGASPALGESESSFLFTIIRLDDQQPVAWGRRLDDPEVLLKCAELKEQGIAFSVRPIISTADLMTAENLERGYSTDIPGFDGDTFTSSARQQIKDGTLYRGAE